MFHNRTLKSHFVSSKGTMLSHDNVTWSTRICTEHFEWKNETVVSYLPMSHVAPHIIDGYVIPCCGGTTFIADKHALKGTLVRKGNPYITKKCL